MTEPLDADAIQRLTSVSDPWLSCDGCFERVDTAIDALLDSDTPLEEPLRVHLLSCTVCHEEARSLAELTASDHGLSRNEASRRLEHAI